MDDISGTIQISTFPFAKHATDPVTINLSETSSHFGAHFDSAALRGWEFPHDCSGAGKSKEKEMIPLQALKGTGEFNKKSVLLPQEQPYDYFHLLISIKRCYRSMK